jgi:hypothetical protein
MTRSPSLLWNVVIGHTVPGLTPARMEELTPAQTMAALEFAENWAKAKEREGRASRRRR